MSDREPRTQGAFVAEGYGRDRGRRIAPPSAAGQHVAHSERGSKSLRGGGVAWARLFDARLGRADGLGGERAEIQVLVGERRDDGAECGPEVVDPRLAPE